MTDHSQMKLGRRKPVHDGRVPRLARYIEAWPPAPDAVDYSGKLTTIGMMRNDALGDCTCAAVGHAIQVWTSQASTEQTISDDDVVALYERFGYSPSNPASDQGAIETEVLSSWQKQPVAGHSIDGFVAIDPSNLAEVRSAVDLFGGVYIGIDMPSAWQSAAVWDVGPDQNGPWAPGSWGGHAVFVLGYDAAGLTFITWGATKRMTWAAWSAYVDEAYAILSPDWKGAEGFDYAALAAELAAIKSGQGPTRNLVVTDLQMQMLQAAVSSKIDGAYEDDGVVGDTTAAQKAWQALADFLDLPRSPKS